MFFLAVYVHMFRGLYYGSYKAPREVLWILGVVIYLLMMATAFLGYVLPWGQMRSGAPPSSPTCSPSIDRSCRISAPRSPPGCGAASRSTIRR